MLGVQTIAPLTLNPNLRPPVLSLDCNSWGFRKLGASSCKLPQKERYYVGSRMWEVYLRQFPSTTLESYTPGCKDPLHIFLWDVSQLSEDGFGSCFRVQHLGFRNFAVYDIYDLHANFGHGLPCSEDEVLRVHHKVRIVTGSPYDRRRRVRHDECRARMEAAEQRWSKAIRMSS